MAVLGLEVADGMVNSNNWKSDSTPFTWHPISEHLDLLEHRDTTSAGNCLCQFCVLKPKKPRPSFLLGSLQL